MKGNSLRPSVNSPWGRQQSLSSLESKPNRWNFSSHITLSIHPIPDRLGASCQVLWIEGCLHFVTLQPTTGCTSQMIQVGRKHDAQRHRAPHICPWFGINCRPGFVPRVPPSQRRPTVDIGRTRSRGKALQTASTIKSANEFGSPKSPLPMKCNHWNDNRMRGLDDWTSVFFDRSYNLSVKCLGQGLDVLVGLCHLAFFSFCYVMFSLDSTRDSGVARLTCTPVPLLQTMRHRDHPPKRKSGVGTRKACTSLPV